MVKPKDGYFRLGAAKTNMLQLKNIGHEPTRLKMWLYKKVNQWENRVNYTPSLYEYWHKRPYKAKK